MLSEGNGNIDVCVSNLLSIFKGEVPYARGKGINQSTLSMSHEQIEQQLIADADDVIDAYEPRAIESTVIIDTVENNGDYRYTVNVKEG